MRGQSESQVGCVGKSISWEQEHWPNKVRYGAAREVCSGWEMAWDQSRKESKSEVTSFLYGAGDLDALYRARHVRSV